jgi:hypothetical protein
VTKRQYQLFALVLLIGAPLMVSLLSGYFLPGLRQIAPGPLAPPPQPEYMQPAPNPNDGLPPALPPPPPSTQPMQNGPQAGGLYDAPPSLNPSGVAIAGTDPMPGGAGTLPPSTAQAEGPSAGDIAAGQAQLAADAEHHHN